MSDVTLSGYDVTLWNMIKAAEIDWYFESRMEERGEMEPEERFNPKKFEEFLGEIGHQLEMHNHDFDGEE